MEYELGSVHRGTQSFLSIFVLVSGTQNRSFTQEQNDCLSVFVSVRMGMQSFRSTVVFLVLAIFASNNYIYARAQGKNFTVSYFGTVLLLVACSHVKGAERKSFVSFHFSYHYLMLPLFGTE